MRLLANQTRVRIQDCKNYTKISKIRTILVAVGLYLKDPIGIRYTCINCAEVRRDLEDGMLE